MNKRIKKLTGILKNKEENRDNLKWMVAQAKPFKWLLTAMLLLNIVSLLLSFAGTIVGKYVVDKATGTGLQPKYVLIMVGTTLLSILFSAGFRVFNGYVNEQFAFGLRCDMFANMQRSIWHRLTKFHSGDTVTRLTVDVDSIATGIISTVPGTIITGLQLIIAFCILYYFDKTLAVFALIIGPIGALTAVFFREKYKEYQLRLRESESEYRSFMQENLANITVVKTFHMEDENNRHLQEIRKRRLKIIMLSSRLGAVMSAIMRLIYSAGYIFAFCWGAYRLQIGEITYGTMTIFITLVSQVQGAIGSLAKVLPQYYSMLISAKRIREISELKNEKYIGKTDVPDEVGICVKGVNFSYDAQHILKDVCLDIKPGEHIGIVGSSGAGKTTLVRLLLALVEPDSGKLDYVADGINEPVTPDSRRFISYVPQGNTLLAGSIEKNLLAGCPTATSEDMWAALEKAKAAEFVRNLPEGLEASLTEHAGGLSEGQAQRVAIARALLRQKPVLILDEATSALDEATEAQVLDSITRGCTQTCLIITHRRSMLRYCDRVVEISDKGVVTISECEHRLTTESEELNGI